MGPIRTILIQTTMDSNEIDLVLFPYKKRKINLTYNMRYLCLNGNLRLLLLYGLFASMQNNCKTNKQVGQKFIDRFQQLQVGAIYEQPACAGSSV